MAFVGDARIVSLELVSQLADAPNVPEIVSLLADRAAGMNLTVPQPYALKVEVSDGAADFIGGLCGGALECISGHPFDTVKVKMVANGPHSPSTLNIFAQIIQRDSVAGLYRGVQSPLAGLALLNASVFFSYGMASDLVASRCKCDREALSLTSVFLAGALGPGIFASLVEAPVEFFKCQMQNHGKMYNFKGLGDCCRTIVGLRGCLSCFQGSSAVLLRNVPAYAFYFASYEGTLRVLRKQRGRHEHWHDFAGGAMAGLAFFGPTYPADVLKTKLQSQTIHPHNQKYAGLLDCARQTFRADGWRGFTVGMAPCLLRAAPANAFCFLGYGLALSAMGKH